MAQTLIQVKDLKKYYNGGDVKALNGVTVDVYKGDVIAVIGPSGGGKSTFLRSLNLLETPTSGSIIFDGVDITGKKVDLPLHRQKMGMVFQHFNLFPNKTVLDNLTMAPIKIKKVPKSEAEQKAMALLQRVGLADRANDYPAQLSGGHPFMTGSSGWAYFAATQYMLGIRPDFDGITVDPCIPADWKEFSVSRKWRGAEYHIHVTNPDAVEKGVKRITMNGRQVRKLPVLPVGTVCDVEVVMG